MNASSLNFNTVKKIYFIGIGGIAMSAAANLAREAGFEVLGSDSKELYAPAKDILDAKKIKYFAGYDIENIKNNPADLYVLSAGEGLENPEAGFILEKQLPRCGFAELLYELSKENLRIVVAGTHGKTTTAGLLGHLFKNLDDSSFLAGGVLQNYNSNFYKGEGHYFVFEGDEYKNQFDDPTPKFHYYKPDILVLTNLEYDHPDMFDSFEDLEKEFRELVEEMPEDGLIVYNADNINLARLVHESNVTSVGFGIENETDFTVENMDYGPEFTTIKVLNKNTGDVTAKLLNLSEEYKIQLPGKMNVYNALAAVATLRTLGFPADSISLDLVTYRGIKRRFELVGKKNGVTIIDDYAHHPTAVRETLEAARLRYFPHTPITPPASQPPLLEKEGSGKQSGGASSPQRGEVSAEADGGVGLNYLGLKIKDAGKLWAIFEPHTFSRTKATLPELAKAFEAVDEALISEIYPAREKISEATIKASEVVDAILQYSPPAKGEYDALASGRGMKQVRLVKDKQQALSILKSETRPGDVVIVMAVGSFNRLAYELKNIL